MVWRSADATIPQADRGDLSQCYDQLLPDQLDPDQLLPDQDDPDQLLPDQLDPDQLLPDQLDPDQLLPDQDDPDQLLPDQLDPDQLLPDQLDPDQSSVPVHVVADSLAWTQASGSHAAPVTVYSPTRTSPPMVTWSSPRAASSEPRPVDGVQFWGAAEAVWVIAKDRLMTPWPWSLDARPKSVAVAVSRFLISSGVSSGRCSRSSAAAPETTAADCEVPDPRNSRSSPGILASG